MGRAQKSGWAALAVALACGLAGCGTPGAPQPPSLKLPERVADLAAVRIGDQVALTWTMPKKNTDHLLIKGDVTVQVWLKIAKGGAWPENGDTEIPVGDEFKLAPGAHGSLTMPLVDDWATGSPRPFNSFVELKNRNGRSAGMSNAAVVLAGEAPAPLTGLTAEMRKGGVVLRWTPAASAASATAIRLRRKLLTPPVAKTQESLPAPAPERAEEDLLVEAVAGAGAQDGRALDKNFTFGQVYEYRAQRVARITVEGQSVELAGPFSAPVRIEAQDIFPPDAPTGLAAVATTGENGAAPSIDLSWQPNTEPDLAGYVVYRREGDGAWQRISSAQPVVPPAFHDIEVQPSHAYRYAVSAIDQSGHEGARSAEAEETVPNP